MWLKWDASSDIRTGLAGRPSAIQPQVPTRFEEQVKKLGLNEQTCVTSKALRQWCEENKKRSYIPEWLPKKWAIPVDPNVTEDQDPQSSSYMSAHS